MYFMLQRVKKKGGGGEQKYEALNRDRYGALTVIKFARNV